MQARIAHVAIWTWDLERMAGFWRDFFGASVGPLYRSARRPGFVSRFLTLSGGPAIELMQGPWIVPVLPQARGVEERAGYAHVAIALGSREAVQALAARAAALGILQSGPRMTGDGYFEAVVVDPDGNPVEITE